MWLSPEFKDAFNMFHSILLYTYMISNSIEKYTTLDKDPNVHSR